MARTKKEIAERTTEILETTPKKRGRKPKAEKEAEVIKVVKSEKAELIEEAPAEEAPKTRGRKKAAEKKNESPFVFGERSKRRNTLTIKITLTEDLLGTLPSDPDIYTNFIATKDENMTDEKLKEELMTLRREREQAYNTGDSVPDDDLGKTTIFAKDDDGNPFLYDYLVKRFFKNACSAMKMADDSQSAAITAYKKKIDNLVFVFPRQLKLHFEGNMSICQRPLRANTPQGERIALSSSESIPAGAYFYCTITTFSESLMASIEEWLDYGIFNGLGQWHNSGKGRFLWEPVETDDVPEDEVELRKFLGKYR